MIFYVAHDSAGKIQQSGCAPSTNEIPPFVGLTVLQVDMMLDPAGAYVADGRCVALPQRPSPHHDWDWPSKTWQPNVAHAIAARKAEVEAERERRNRLPIDHAGARFDADETAQRNISAWQTQMGAGAVLPAGFMWRDYDNIDHPADAAFINGLGAAITLRGTLLYQASWQHKAALDALSSVEAILIYDLTAGWPA